MTAREKAARRRKDREPLPPRSSCPICRSGSRAVHGCISPRPSRSLRVRHAKA